MENGLSPADVAAMTGTEGGFGGWTGLIALLIIASIFTGGGGLTGGGRDYGQYATAASQQEILFGQQFQGLDSKIDRIGNGIADATFALNNSVGAVGTQVQEAKYDNALRIGDVGAKLAQCCCDTKQAIGEVNYNGAMNTAAVNANVTAQAQRVIDTIQQNKVDALQAQVSELKTQQMFCGIPRINPYGYNVVPSFPQFCGGTQF